MYYISLYYFVVHCKSFKERFFKTAFFRKADAKVDVFQIPTKHSTNFFLRKMQLFILSVTQTLDNQTMFKNIFLKKKIPEGLK